MRKQRRLILVSLLCATGCGVVVPVPSALAAGTGALKLEILSSQSLAERPYIFLRGAMSGDLTRLDGTTGTFKVPVWLVHPRRASECNRFGVVEPIHTGGLPSFLASISNAEEGNQGADWPTLANGASLFGRHHGGYVWAGVVWSQAFLEALKGTEFQGIAIDDSYHIENGVTDRYIVLEAASRIERNPSAFIAHSGRHGGPPCAARRVISGGSSQSAQIVRAFYFNGQNTGLASDTSFWDGFVFDGSIQGGIVENVCRRLDGSLDVCNGPTPAEQGKVITINSEFDVQFTLADPDLGFITGRLARGAAPHWRIYEIAGATHIPTFTGDFKAFGIKPASMPDQNYADTRPAYRAVVENLRKWVGKGTEPPPNALLEGHVMDLQFREDFDVLPWFMPSAFVPPSFDRSGDYDLNADGGIRLPHVRTRDFGGPLGLYRGVECNNPRPLTDALECPLVPEALLDDPALELILLGGSVVPYTALGGELSASGLESPCENYESLHAYLTAVKRAAKYAVRKRWVLSDEIELMVAAAKEKAAQYPGCVPTS